ncbi:glutamate--tRNA ligase [bacterium]|nr:MAG: glutamate--tRNA ligase [bacterium]
MSVRVRFAPSPTGLLHVGALRTVLFDYLLRQKEGGSLILRIEDTDRSRYNPDSEQEFVDTLKWVGIEFDEGPHVGGPNGPYRQSERKEAGLYTEAVAKLLAEGNAYKAFDTPQELEEMRELQQLNKKATGYFGGNWRDASPEMVAAAEAEGKPFVVRQKVPHGRKIVLQDLVRGRLEWESDVLDDQVLLKADGMPTYHLAAMVDDHAMGITHVLRGEEWLPSAPKHALLFEQLGWEAPVFVHCPVIIGADGKKLSKRHGATRVLDYAGQGILPVALKNFIALIGWSPGEDREAMPEKELIEAFDLSRIQASPGRFDLEKLKWLNGWHMRQLDPAELLELLLSFIDAPHVRSYWEEFVDENAMPNQPKVDGKVILAKLATIAEAVSKDRNYVLAALKEEQERVTTLADFGEALEFFLVEEPPMDPKAEAKWLKQPHAPELFRYILSKLDESGVETVSHYEAMLREFQTQKGFEKLGPVVHPVRVALTGKTFGPGLYELMSVLGRDRIRTRLERVLRSAE